MPTCRATLTAIQIIAERTTLPQMLAELSKGLNRHADVATLVLQLKCANAFLPCLVCGLRIMQ